jgi:phosphate transport system substrate-binding protein
MVNMIARTTRGGSLTLFLALGLGLSVAGCDRAQAPEGAHDATAPLTGRITMDGSATLLPVSTAVTAAFGKTNTGVQVSVQTSGTGGGFKKFCGGEIDIAGASRPINAAESQQCRNNRIEFIELPFALDSLSVVVNAANSFVDCLTVDELKKMWEPAAEGKISRWNQIRASFPDQPLALFGPGTDSGTFDYFTLAIVGTESSSRRDYTKSEDDGVIVKGVAGDPNALGYFGYAYYRANKEKMKLVSIDSGHGCVAPSTQTVADNSYQPLTRPLFIYVSKSAASRAETTAFAQFYVAPEQAGYVSAVGYQPLPPATLLAMARRLDTGETGSMFGGHGSVLGVTARTFEDDDRVRNALVQ